MLSQCLSVADTIPITIAMPKGKKKHFHECKLHVRVVHGSNLPNQLFGAPSSFASCYWDGAAVCAPGEYAPHGNAESEELENKHFLFHTPTINKEQSPHWDFPGTLSIQPSLVHNAHKIRFVVRQKSKVLAESIVALDTICALIHDETNVQTAEDGAMTSPMAVTLPLNTPNRSPGQPQATLRVEFALESIPNQVLAFLKQVVAQTGFHWRVVQNLIRVALLYRHVSALDTIMDLASTWTTEEETGKPEDSLLEFLMSSDRLYVLLVRLQWFTGDLHRDVRKPTNLHYVITCFLQWLAQAMSPDRSWMSRSYNGSTILGFALVNNNVDLVEWLLSQDVSLSTSHWHEDHEYYYDELIATCNASPKPIPECTALMGDRMSDPSVQKEIEATRRDRDIRQQRRDLIRQMFFMQATDQFIATLAVNTVHIKHEMNVIVSTFGQYFHQLPRDTNVETSEDRSFPEVDEAHRKWEECLRLRESYSEIELFEYCEMDKTTQQALCLLAQQTIDLASDHHLPWLHRYLDFVVNALRFFNMNERAPNLHPKSNNLAQVLELSDHYPTLRPLILLSAASSFALRSLSLEQYQDCLHSVIRNFCYLLVPYVEPPSSLASEQDASELDWSEGGDLFGYLTLMQALLNTTPPELRLLPLIQQHSLLSLLKVILTAPQQLGLEQPPPCYSEKEFSTTQDDSIYMQIMQLVLGILASMVREIVVANWLVTTDLVIPVFEIVTQYRDCHRIYRPGVLLLNRLIVEDQAMLRANESIGWEKLDPSRLGGGTYFLDKYRIQISELMWHGLNEFCYTTPMTSASACGLVWRLLYYNCIPPEELSAFVDCFMSKFRRLWELNHLDLKVCILQVLRRILTISRLFCDRVIVHLSIEHDFLSYSFKCIKQFGCANKPEIIQTAFDYLAIISSNEKIWYQLTQNPDWIIAEHIMTCLRHSDLRDNASLQGSGLWLVGKLIKEQQATNLFVEILNQCEILDHLFCYVFRKYHLPEYHVVCNSAISVLNLMMNNHAVFQTFMRLRGMEHLIRILKRGTFRHESFPRHVFCIFNIACLYSRTAQKLAIAHNVPHYIHTLMQQFPALQSDKVTQSLLRRLTVRDQ